VEIIRELEPVPRGLYTGAIGYFGATGDSHFSIAIRTMVLERGVISCHAGAGIVADSSPAAEWEETLQKASGMLAAGRSS
jgi:anthranilate/para-aminobenzoate synthase component I